MRESLFQTASIRYLQRWKGDGCMKDTDHHLRHPRGHLGDRASALGTKGCSSRGDQFGRGQKIVLGWSDPTFVHGSVAKVITGSLQPSQAPRANASCAVALGNAENLSDNMSDILCEQERRSQLSILKAPPKQPKTVTVQARVEESVKTQLECYAEFIDTSPSYVITEALKLLFRKDDDFRRWADVHANNHNNERAQGDVLAKAV